MYEIVQENEIDYNNNQVETSQSQDQDIQNESIPRESKDTNSQVDQENAIQSDTQSKGDTPTDATRNRNVSLDNIDQYDSVIDAAINDCALNKQIVRQQVQSLYEDDKPSIQDLTGVYDPREEEYVGGIINPETGTQYTVKEANLILQEYEKELQKQNSLIPQYEQMLEKGLNDIVVINSKYPQLDPNNKQFNKKLYSLFQHDIVSSTKIITIKGKDLRYNDNVLGIADNLMSKFKIGNNNTKQRLQAIKQKRKERNKTTNSNSITIPASNYKSQQNNPNATSNNGGIMYWGD